MDVLSGQGFRERLSFALPGSPDAVTDARHRIAKAVRGRLRRDDLHRVELLVSEIVSNAVRHGGTEMQVVLMLFDDGIRVEVSDAGPGFVPERGRPSPEADAGWGLYLVEQLSDEWGVARKEGTQVWFEVAAGRPGAA